MVPSAGKRFLCDVWGFDSVDVDVSVLLNVNLCSVVNRIRRFERALRFIETSGLRLLSP